ncbi:hypothetical protein M9H77_25461 [Catharanthus roseus]|uniref:Uncharacterized protein n=1 Tax=Catharanthus roseus TaxID=4058 RepID=A0ACC0A6Z0_CATRO|nr:hypothetical protein M9H77_25461 [Catharanthus roseus]
MNKSTTSTSSSSSTTTTTPKKSKHRHHLHHQPQQQQEKDHHQSLLPGLPDHIAQICLSHVQPSLLYSVSKSWRRLIYSPSFPPFLSIYAILLPKQTKSNILPNSIRFCCFDPISALWNAVPQPPPPDPPLSLLLHHPSFISRRLPVQSVTVSGRLVFLAATANHFVPALSRPLIFNPLSQNWTYGPPLAAPRRWCAAGASRGVVYVASGIGSHYNPEVARSVEKWDLEINHRRSVIKRRGPQQTTWKWEKIEGMRDGKFSREAIDAIGWRGKLCMVNVKGDAAKEGIIYNVENDGWEDMPGGMLMGWKGPAASMNEEIIYMVDESKGVLKKYDREMDTWVEILEDDSLKGADYIAAAGGKVCVVGGAGDSILVVDVRVTPSRFWVVDTPVGSQAIAVHILPRMNQTKNGLSSLEGLC